MTVEVDDYLAVCDAEIEAYLAVCNRESGGGEP